MLPKAFLVKTILYSFLCAVLVLPSIAHADEKSDALKKKLTELNEITGNDAIIGSYRLLKDNPDFAKELIAYASKAMAKDEKTIDYNSAFVLAELARDFNNVADSEKFFQYCTKKAAKLESTRKLLQSYGGLIDLLYENKSYDKAAAVCRELLELKTGGDRPRTVILSVDSRFGEPSFIELDNYDSASNLKPAVHRLLIQAIAKQGKYDRALKLADNLIEARDSWSERQLKGWVLYEAGRYADAAKAYEDVLDRVIRDPQLSAQEKGKYEDDIRYVLSNIFIELKQVDRAAEQLQSLIRRNPDRPGFYNDLGYIWANNDMNLDKAEEYVRKALELDRKRRKSNPNLSPENDKDNGAYLDSLGWVLFKQKKYAEAKKYLEEAIEDPESQHIEIYDHLGDVYLALGDEKKAVEAWRRGLQFAGPSARDQRIRMAVEAKVKKYAK